MGTAFDIHIGTWGAKRQKVGLIAIVAHILLWLLRLMAVRHHALRPVVAASRRYDTLLIPGGTENARTVSTFVYS